MATDSPFSAETFGEIEQALQRAFDLTERLGWNLKRLYSGTVDVEPVPTLEDVGRLFSFYTSLEAQVDQLGEKKAEFHERLHDVDCARLDAEVRGVGINA